jgi:uncharacterized membrane protein
MGVFQQLAELRKGGILMEEQGRSSTGLDESVAGLLCYMFGFVTGIIFLIVEKESRFVKFHAMQSTITFLGVFVILVVFGWVPLLGLLIWIAALVLWLFLMVNALRGKMVELPVVGKWAAEKAKK